MEMIDDFQALSRQFSLERLMPSVVNGQGQVLIIKDENDLDGYLQYILARDKKTLLVNDIGSVVLECEHILLVDLLRKAARLLQPLLEQRRMSFSTFVLPAGLTVSANKKGMLVVLAALIENSLKYCPMGTRISILGRDDGERTILRVADNGPGITSQEQAEIFQKYYRGKRNRGTRPGNGLGLYIARTLIEAMGGTITLESSPGAGCVFSLGFAKPIPFAKFLPLPGSREETARWF